MKAVVVLALVLAGAVAHADPEPNGRVPIGPSMREIREMFERGEYERAREELLRMYALVPQPAFLFALGQAELNLGHYEAAIGYYEKFLATNPTPEQAALAQQAIGAARIRLSEPPKDKDTDKDKVIEAPPPPPEQPPDEGRHWTLTHTGLVAFGGAAVLLGTGLLLYSRSLGNDRSGTLSAYDSRVDQARTTRWTGAGIAAAGTLLIGVTVLW